MQESQDVITIREIAWMLLAREDLTIHKSTMTIMNLDIKLKLLGNACNNIYTRLNTCLDCRRSLLLPIQDRQQFFSS